MRRPGRLATAIAIIFALLFITACSNDGAVERTDTPPKSPPPETTELPEPARERTAERGSESTKSTAAPPESTPEPEYGYTYGTPSGNLVADGEGGMPLSDAVDVPLGGVPVWVAGVPFREGVAWVVALDDGGVEDFYVGASGGVEPLEVSPSRLAPGEPPLVKVEGGSLELAASRNGVESDLTHPVPDGDGLLGVQENGEVFIEEGDSDAVSIGSTSVGAPPDARIARSESGRAAVLSEPTERYAHAVLGDGIEAASISVFGGPDGARTIRPESGGVFEEISPMWVEADGREYLAVSESAEGVGTRVSLYSPDGTLAAAGPPVGEPFKWRHILAAGPFGPEGEFEISAVRTPHLDATVEFYRPDFESGTMEIVAELPGYTSHRINTRNLDTARAGDMDGDGRWELLVPNPSYTELAAIRRTGAGAEVVWTLPAGGEISTNIASATDEGGSTSIAVGLSDGRMRVWR